MLTRRLAGALRMLLQTNQEAKLYFNIDKPLNWQSRKLQP